MQVNRPAWMVRSTFLRLLPVAPSTRMAIVRVRLVPLLRDLDPLLAGQVGAGQRTRRLQDVLEQALGDDFAAVHAGAGPDIDDVVGHADRVLVVLDHDDGIAHVAQPGQRAEQALVVALVQADRGLVEHVHHADQAGADLRGQADALRFAARQRVGLALQGQVVEADVDQEAQALADFLDDLHRHLAAPAGQAQLREEGQRLVHRQLGDLRQRMLGDEHVARRAVEARAAAFGAGARADELAPALPSPPAIRSPGSAAPGSGRCPRTCACAGCGRPTR